MIDDRQITLTLHELAGADVVADQRETD